MAFWKKISYRIIHEPIEINYRTFYSKNTKNPVFPQASEFPSTPFSKQKYDVFVENFSFSFWSKISCFHPKSCCMFSW